MFYKFGALLLLIMGEFLTIYAEIAGAKSTQSSQSIMTWSNFGWAGLVVLGSILLLIGYGMGQLAFKNIWTVYAISVTTILIVEPILAYLIFRDLPGRGSTIGAILGGTGLLVTLLF